MAPAFLLLPIDQLKAHEEVDPHKVERIAREIRSSGLVEEPVWVARGEGVILNGHHRVAALASLGARRVPAWVLNYSDPAVHLDRWGPGPPISKEEVLRRARQGPLFPPKTSRHSLAVELPRRPTPLSELLAAEASHRARC